MQDNRRSGVMCGAIDDDRMMQGEGDHVLPCCCDDCDQVGADCD